MPTPFVPSSAAAAALEKQELERSHVCQIKEDSEARRDTLDIE
jgi:hypothetical protein